MLTSSSRKFELITDCLDRCAFNVQTVGFMQYKC